MHLEDNYLGFEFLSESLDTITHLRRIIELNLGNEYAFHQELSELWSK